MKKSKFFIGLSAAFVAFTSLMSCSGNVRSNGDVILTIDGEDFTAEQLFGDIKVTEAAAKEMFDAVYRVAVRKYFTKGEPGWQYHSEIEKDTKIKMSGQKDIAQSNADKNGTSYAEEWQKILDSNGVEDEEELEAKFEYEIEKDKFNEKFYEGNSDKDKNKNLEILRDGGKFGDDEPAIDDPERMDGYLKEKRPYHVRHILVKVSAAKDDPCTGEITESEAKKLSDVITQLANGDDFARVARANSDDTGSKAKGGDLGIMDLDTSFVNEFKLGTYLYESFFSSATNATSEYCDEPAEEGFKLNDGDPKQERSAADYAQKIKSSIIDPTTKESTNATSRAIGQIPFEAALALGKDDYDVTYVDPTTTKTETVTKSAIGNYDYSKLEEKLGGVPLKDVSDKPKYYPRNVIFNKYFNKNNIMVITPSTFHPHNEDHDHENEWLNSSIKTDPEEKKSWRINDDDYSKISANQAFIDKYDGFNRTTLKNDDNVLASFYGNVESSPNVLRDNNGRVIFVFRSGTSSESSNEDEGYQGIHFVCIERSPFIKTEEYTVVEESNDYSVSVSRQEYFTEYYPDQTGGLHPKDDKGRDKLTYSNYVDSDETIDKKARADDLISKFKAYNPNIDTYVYKYLKEGHIEFSPQAEKLGIETIIDNWVKLQREDTEYQTKDKWDKTWKDYYYRLEQTTKARIPQPIGKLPSGETQYKYGIVAEAAAFIYSGKEYGYDDITTYFGAGGAFNE